MTEALSLSDYFKNKKDTSPTNTGTTLSLKSYFDEQQNIDDEPLPILDKGKNLKVDDIVSTQSYVDTIRDYMIDRKGKQYLNKEAEEVVDDFIGLQQMRYFNTNEMFTFDEVRYVSKADEDAKRMAGKAYQIYEKLGNVFVNDGLGGAVGGVADYVGAVLSSPSTYFGVGVGVLSIRASKLGVKAIRWLRKRQEKL